MYAAWRARPMTVLTRLAVTENNAPSGQVIRTELHHHTILWEDPDVVLTHLARNVSEDLVPVGELHPEHSVRKSLHDHTLDLDDTVLLRHVLRIPSTATPWVGMTSVVPVFLLPGTRVTTTCTTTTSRGGVQEQDAREPPH